MVKFLTNDNSVNIGATEIKFIRLESSHWEESNKKKFIKIQSVDHEIFMNEAKKSLLIGHIKFSGFAYFRGTFENFPILHTPVFKRSADRILTNFISLDSSRWEESNGINFISVAPILTELSRVKNLTISKNWPIYGLFGVLLGIL